ncbi:TadE/TadG family type IV pilus assembly protein [uncultured Kocuria sp.]|uniref:TadE/TadG family type IV pilus assembly protein n=1 Tax=uncultured Kocuria sp. TaxID=259305 RepID=UPI0026095F42|nr:TadE family protein [uncultured Kocuria sp.]
MSLWRSERGAAAVEFALVVPILLALVLGIMEFGRAYNAQISLTHAARETARTMAITNVWTDAVTHGVGAAPSLDLESGDFTPSLTTCTPGQQIQVTVTQNLQTITGIADDLTLTGKAAMRCGG